MCNWFSCVSNGKGFMYYLNAEHRQVIYDGGELACKKGQPITTKDGLDSHSAIANFFGVDCDKVNKYEFRPLDRKFTIDQINTSDDSAKIKRKCQRLNYKKLSPPELIMKPIFHPFEGAKRKKATRQDIELLKKWDSAWNSVWASVWDSVRVSVRDSVWDSVRDSAWDSVWVSVRDSVRDSVGAYTGSFFKIDDWKYIKHKKGEYPYQPLVDLWERGIVPSFDGKTWRLHGYKGKVIKEITKQELAETNNERV